MSLCHWMAECVHGEIVRRQALLRTTEDRKLGRTMTFEPKTVGKTYNSQKMSVINQ